MPALPDELVGDPMIARMRSGARRGRPSRAGYREPCTRTRPSSLDRGAAAAVLVAGGIAALAVNMSRDHSTVAGPVPAAGTLLTGQATIIDMGEGPKMAVTLATSLPPQGGDIPLAGFDWSMIDDEQTVNGTTWTDTWQQITGTWDGTTFTITQPPVPAVSSVSTSTPVDQSCPDATAQAAADAIGALDWQALHLTEWYPQNREGVCGVHVGAWFDTQQLRDALDGVRAAGHDVQVQFVFNPVPTDAHRPHDHHRPAQRWRRCVVPDRRDGLHRPPSRVHRVLPADAGPWTRRGDGVDRQCRWPVHAAGDRPCGRQPGGIAVRPLRHDGRTRRSVGGRSGARKWPAIRVGRPEHGTARTGLRWPRHERVAAVHPDDRRR